MTSSDTDSGTAPPRESMIGLVVRGAIGGVMMGLANLVPGISGGTMLVATGVYKAFIEAIAEVSTLKFRLRSLVTLAAVVAPAVAAIVLLSGVMVRWVTGYPLVMFSLFIGLTLGGVPLLKQMLGKGTASSRLACVFMFAAMAALAYVQSFGEAGGVNREGFVFMLIAGMVAAGAMILPGVSGGYMFLLLGVYVPILKGIDALEDAEDVSGRMEVVTGVVLPVGIGVVVGVVVVSNVLKVLLERREKATLGALMGLLLGAVVGLWPFQELVPVDEVARVKGQVVEVVPATEVLLVRGQAVEVIDGLLIYTETKKAVPTDEVVRVEGQGVVVYQDTKEAVERVDYPRQARKPGGVGEVALSLGLIVAGFGATMGLARLGGDRKRESGAD